MLQRVVVAFAMTSPDWFDFEGSPISVHYVPRQMLRVRLN